MQAMLRVEEADNESEGCGEEGWKVEELEFSGFIPRLGLVQIMTPFQRKSQLTGAYEHKIY